MKQISPKELVLWQLEGRQFVLIDVREPYEHAEFNIGGTLASVGELLRNQATFSKDLPIVFYCEKGIRSVIAIQRLEGLGFENLFNLAGGVQAWKKMDVLDKS